MALTRETWVAALRSGEYEQTTGQLRSDTGFCCLGVACDVNDPTLWQRHAGGVVEFSYSDPIKTAYLPEALLVQLNLRSGEEDILTKMNDDGVSFAEIADYIEALP